VILASGVKVRKPAPEPFLEAARTLRVEPVHCAYLGNRFWKDVVGCKQAGFALGFLIEYPDQSHLEENKQSVVIDAVIHSLSELLDIFTPKLL
jgi:FMN phosphatase YigB (HAD superfamily)